MRKYWNNLTPGNRNLLKLISLFLVILALPLTVWVAQQAQNITQKAAFVDQLEAEDGVLGGNATVIADTNASGGKSVRFSQTNPTQSPTPTPSSRKIVTVSSIAALKTALADNTIDEIVVTNGTYFPDIAAHKSATSLWIGAQFAARTRPVLVRAETIGGVTFDGNQQRYWGGITFAEGAHDQTWRGFRWVNGEATDTGVIVVGGYKKLAPTHRLSLEDCEVAEFWGADTGKHGHGIYISQAFGGPHTDLTLLRFKVTDVGEHIGAGIQLYHDSYDGEVASEPNYFNVDGLIVRQALLTGVNDGFHIWAHTAKNILIEDSRVVNARTFGVRYERGENVTFRRVVTTGSGAAGFGPTIYVPGGPYHYPTIPELGVDKVPGPKLVTFEACSFDP